MKSIICLYLFLFLQLARPVAAEAAVVMQLVAFGDSLTDTGNVYNLTSGLIPAPPNFQGRFSNGPVYVERLAELLGIAAPTPSRAGGTNYAHGSAQTGSTPSLIPNMGTQVSSYLATSPIIDAGQLFVLYGGANDFLSGGQSDTSVPVNNLSSQISTLYLTGAKNFLVPNLPPLGSTPGYRGTADEIRLNNLALEFNTGLEIELSRMEASLGLTIQRLDVYGMVQEALGNPSAFGFTNVTDPAFNFSTGSVVSNVDQYLFWDSLHPTAAAHRVLGDRAALAVPEPVSTCGLLLLAAVGGLQHRKRRASRAS